MPLLRADGPRESGGRADSQRFQVDVDAGSALASAALAQVARRANRAAQKAGVAAGLSHAGAGGYSAGYFVPQRRQVGGVCNGIIPRVLLLLPQLHESDEFSEARKAAGGVCGLGS